MTAKHTPGPWKTSTIAPLNICSQSGHLIADCCSSWQSHDGVRESNARLIAAAPELLDALKRILYAHDTGNCGASMGEAVLCEYYAEMARAIIAKAESAA